MSVVRPYCSCAAAIGVVSTVERWEDKAFIVTVVTPCNRVWRVWTVKRGHVEATVCQPILRVY